MCRFTPKRHAAQSARCPLCAIADMPMLPRDAYPGGQRSTSRGIAGDFSEAPHRVERHQQNNAYFLTVLVSDWHPLWPKTESALNCQLTIITGRAWSSNKISAAKDSLVPAEEAVAAAIRRKTSSKSPFRRSDRGHVTVDFPCRMVASGQQVSLTAE